MKLFSALLITLASTVALAMPSINDSATYELTFSQGGNSVSGTQELIVTSYNESTKLYTVKSTTNINGQSQVKEQQVPVEKLMSDASAEKLMSTCSAQGGAVTQVTVPAGTLSVCSVPVNEQGTTGTVYLGAVPFGLVKMDVSNATQSLQMVLKAYSKGN
jgi:hypothetical protein